MTFTLIDIRNGDQFETEINATCETYAIEEASRIWGKLSEHDRKLRSDFYLIEGKAFADDGEAIDHEPIWEAGYHKYYVADKEAGNLIEYADTIQEAESIIEAYEEADRKECSYTPDFYDIVDENRHSVR